MSLKACDYEIYQAIQKEKRRQTDSLELIASENYTSKNVRAVTGSILTNKYSEGYPGKRYYGGCECVDMVEALAIERVKKLFKVKYANVQPHSGSSANQAAIRALINHGDTVLGMALDHGGHLTHGHALSFSGQDYQFYFYGVNSDTYLIDYDALQALALEKQPKLIIAGASAYPRFIDFPRMRQIADSVGAYLMVDMAHIAGLVATDLHPSPVGYADVITSTTHKTLRGPRGGFILTDNPDLAVKINRAVFPGIQGGPLMHVIAGKAVAFKEALEPSFHEYQMQVLKNAKVLAAELEKRGYEIVSHGTDNHMLLVNIKNTLGITGRVAEQVLEKVGIACNKNTIPNDPEKPMLTSGIRLGTPAVTTRGLKETEMIEVALLIDETLRNYQNKEVLRTIHQKVLALCKKFPLKNC